MNRWKGLFEGQGPRLVAGVMSGTSLDGIDVALVRLTGSGRAMRIETVATGSEDFPAPVSEQLKRIAEGNTLEVDVLTRLQPRLAQVYAHAVRNIAGSETPDLIGCHGQTVRHQPDAQDFAGGAVAGTLQLMDGPALAALLETPVVHEFRTADVVLGGQGAPLAPYLDYVALSSDTQHRVALNLGGIANITALKASGDPDDLLAFDTGPANVLMDALAERFLDQRFDVDGKTAASGAVLGDLLAWALSHPYFARIPPKSTGRQTEGAGFGQGFLSAFLERAPGALPEDLLATAAEVTVRSIAQSIEQFVPFRPECVIAAGGGTRNPFLMARLQDALGKVALTTTDEFGVDAHYKEAIAFAVLAHEAVNGVETGLPSVTGASRATVLGSITWP